MKKICSYINNLIDGEYKDFYENRNVYAKLAYQNGLRVGISQWFYETGELRKKQKLIKENIYSIEHYNNDSLIQKGTFFRNESIFYWIGEHKFYSEKGECNE